MSTERAEAFEDSVLNHLRILIEEEAALWEVPLETTTITANESLRSGPWVAEKCAQVLIKWLEAGLIGVFRFDESTTPVDLSQPEAYVALSRWERWRPDGTQRFLYCTSRGAETPDQGWVAAAR